MAGLRWLEWLQEAVVAALAMVAAAGGRTPTPSPLPFYDTAGLRWLWLLLQEAAAVLAALALVAAAGGRTPTLLCGGLAVVAAGGGRTHLAFQRCRRIRDSTPTPQPQQTEPIGHAKLESGSHAARGGWTHLARYISWYHIKSEQSWLRSQPHPHTTRHPCVLAVASPLAALPTLTSTPYTRMTAHAG